MKNRFSPNFSRIIEYDKLQRTIYRGPQGVLAIAVKVLRSNLSDVRVFWEQTFKKRARHPVKKWVSPIFSRVIEPHKCQGPTYEGQMELWHLVWE